MAYTSTDSPMIIYLNDHVALEQMREKAEKTGTVHSMIADHPARTKAYEELDGRVMGLHRSSGCGWLKFGGK